jgi:hypothetical protein
VFDAIVKILVMQECVEAMRDADADAAGLTTPR